MQGMDLARGRAVVHVRKWIKEKNDYERHEFSSAKDGTS